MRNKVTINRIKRWGRFYTPSSIAGLVVDWAIRKKDDSVLDIATGDGVFLLESARRLRELGSSDREIEELLHGTEISKRACRRTRDNLFRTFQISSKNIYNSDFFGMMPNQDLEGVVRNTHMIPPVRAVIGNPPFVKYSLMDERSRRRALKRVKALGYASKGAVDESVFFLIHGSSFLVPEGRLALVMPERLLFTEYGSIARDYLKAHFRSVRLVLCNGWSFARALERVVLVMATNAEAGGFVVQKMNHEVHAASETDSLERIGEWSPDQLSPQSWSMLRFDSKYASLLSNLSAMPPVHPLRDFASVEIGCVTGANHFFVLSRSLVSHSSIPHSFFAPSVSKASQIKGLFLRMKDWRELLKGDERCFLLQVNPRHPAIRSKYVQRYLSYGRRIGIRDRYKISDRPRWYEVPAYKPASALFTYMSHEYPRLVINSARAINTNSVHSVRLGVKDKTAFCASFYNSLTLLSCELLGRVYSGGVLKLEPSELERVLVVDPLELEIAERLDSMSTVVNERLARHDLEGVLDVVDPIVLEEGLQLGKAEAGKLRTSYSNLRRARMQR